MPRDLLYGAAGVALLILIVVGQLRQRVLNPRRLVIMPVVFAAVGLFADKRLGHELSGAAALGLFAAGLLVAVVMGVLRGWTVRVSVGPGAVTTQGTWWTVALWAATLVVRSALVVVGVTAGVREGVGEAFVFVAATIAVQNAYVFLRANRLAGGNEPAVEGAG